MVAARSDKGVGATGAKRRQGEGAQTEGPKVVRAGRPRLCVDGRQQQPGREGGAGRPRPGTACCGAGHDLGSRRRGGQRHRAVAGRLPPRELRSTPTLR